MAANRSIKLSWASSHYRYGTDDGVRVRFDVICAEEMTTKVFAYRMLPLSPKTGEAVGTFSHVCSPPDVAEYPADEPAPASSPEWFRLSYVDVLVRSVTEAENFIAGVREDVRRLKLTYDKMDEIFPGGTDILGDDCDPPLLSSSSASSSDSSSLSIGGLQALATIGTSEQSVGVGVPWVDIGTGAGSPIGDSDSLAMNRSRVELIAGQASQVLLVQGFDFSEIPDNAIVEGLHTRTVLREDKLGVSGSSSSSLSSVSSQSSQEAGTPRRPVLTFLALQHPEFGLGDDKALGEVIDGPAWQTMLHGGSGDLWGFPQMSGADLKRGSFGLSLVTEIDKETAEAAVEVDGVELTAYYREVV
jgi:hypothetical protein